MDMKLAQFLLLGVALFAIPQWLAPGQSQTESATAKQDSRDQLGSSDAALQAEFPLVVEVSKSQYDNPFENNMATLAKAEAMGSAPPVLVVLTATINGESHWVVMCRRENVSYEINPCTPLAAGKYPARLVHNGELLQLLVKDDQGKVDWRFFDLTPKRRDPPASDDRVLQASRSQFLLTPPDGKRAADYPMLLHVYGAVRLRFPVGNLPEHTRCTFSSYNPHSITDRLCELGRSRDLQGPR
jgi:hypothetical protein